MCIVVPPLTDALGQVTRRLNTPVPEMGNVCPDVFSRRRESLNMKNTIVSAPYRQTQQECWSRCSSSNPLAPGVQSSLPIFSVETLTEGQASLQLMFINHDRERDTWCLAGNRIKIHAI